MKRLKGWELFGEIKEMKERGFNKSQTSRNLLIDFETVSNYWNMTPDEYAKLLEKRKIRVKKLDQYEEEIVSWLRDYPDMSTSQIFDWLEEKYGSMNCTDRSARNFLNCIRTEYSIPKIKHIRQYEAVEDLPMGYQAQVDFGQIWLKTDKHSRIKLYCFTMVLSHSRYKFALWMDRPFTTIDFIQAHDMAFKHLGGMPIEIVYDQDRLLAVDENYGDIVFTEEFQKYIYLMKFKIYLCRGFDPASKGRIEAVVKFVKYNFAEHRIFSDIATFNEECQSWLERTGNGKIHGTTKKIPKEVFALEKEHLLPIPNVVNELTSNTSLTYVVRKDNTILYKQNRYGVPKGTYSPGKRVKLEIDPNFVIISDIEMKIVIIKHKLCKEKGKLLKITHTERERDTKLEDMYNEVLALLGGGDNPIQFLNNIKELKPRYMRDQLSVIKKTVASVSAEIIKDSLDYCIKRGLFSATLFNDTILFMNDKQKTTINIKQSQSNPIPEKYRNIKTQVRDTNEYKQAMEG